MENQTIVNLPKKILMFFIVIIVLLAIGVVGFLAIKNVSFIDAITITLQSFAFMFSEETGMAKALQVFLAIFGVMTLGWVLSGILNIIFEGHLSEYLKTSRFLYNLKKMRNHYIIAGGGRVGEEIARTLVKKNKQYIILEKDSIKVSKLKKKGFRVIQGDVTDSDSSDIIKAGIMNAKKIILTMPETEKNLLVTMSIRELNSKIEIYARADNPSFAKQLKKAGAKVVIVPEIAAAEKFLKSID